MAYSPDQDVTWYGDGGIIVEVGGDQLLIRSEEGPCPVDEDCAVKKCGGRVLEHAEVVLVSTDGERAIVLKMYRCPMWEQQ